MTQQVKDLVLSLLCLMSPLWLSSLLWCSLIPDLGTTKEKKRKKAMYKWALFFVLSTLTSLIWFI